MQAATIRKLRRWLGDLAVGAAVFALVPLLALTLPHHHRNPAPSFADAFAGEVIATRAIDVTSPNDAVAETAIVAAALMSPDGAVMDVRSLSDLTVLGMTFSLLFALNVAFFRHLRRVKPVRRQEVWRKPSP